MSYRVLLTKAARKQLDALPTPAVESISERLLLLKDNPRPSGCKRIGSSRNFRKGTAVGSRSDLMRVAVGFSPRTGAGGTRVAERRLMAMQTNFKRRSATQILVSFYPWAEAHGYHHSLATRGTVFAHLRLVAIPRKSQKYQKLQSRDGWRIRVGDYRVIYHLQDDALVVLVITVGHRRDVYR